MEIRLSPKIELGENVLSPGRRTTSPGGRFIWSISFFHENQGSEHTSVLGESESEAELLFLSVHLLCVQD